MPGGDLYHPKGAAGGVGTGGGIALSASNKLYTSGTVVISGSTNITVLTNGQTILLSGNDPAAAAGVSAIQASNTTYTSGKVILTGVGGGVTVSSNTGQRVDISVAAPVAQTAETAISGVSASDTLYTSGTVRFTGVGGGITVSSNTGQRVDLSVAAPVAQTVQTQNLVDVTLSGNTAGALALISSGTLTLAGGNRVTLSQAGNAVTISGGAETQTAISGIAGSNTTYTSGTVSFTGVGGGVTVSSNTGQRIDISVAAPSQCSRVIQHIIASNTTFSSGTVSISGFGDVTVNTAANIIRISAPVQTAQTGLSGVAASNTTYTSGTFTITGVGGGVTVSSNTGQRVDISVAAPVAQTVQTQNVVDVTLSGNTAGAMALVSSGTLTLAGGNNITLSQAGNAVTISGAAAGGAQTAISGIAASNTTYTSGSVTFTGVGGGVTVSSNTGQRIDISVAAPVAQTVQTQQNVQSIAASNTTYHTGQVEFTGSNMITVKSSANQRVVIDATQTVQTQNSLNLTLAGNTGGALAQVSSGTLTLAGGNNITLSQAGNAVTISGGAGQAASQAAASPAATPLATPDSVTGRLVFARQQHHACPARRTPVRRRSRCQPDRVLGLIKALPDDLRAQRSDAAHPEHIASVSAGGAGIHHRRTTAGLFLTVTGATGSSAALSTDRRSTPRTRARSRSRPPGRAGTPDFRLRRTRRDWGGVLRASSVADHEPDVAVHSRPVRRRVWNRSTNAGSFSIVGLQSGCGRAFRSCRGAEQRDYPDHAVVRCLQRVHDDRDAGGDQRLRRLESAAERQRLRLRLHLPQQFVVVLKWPNRRSSSATRPVTTTRPTRSHGCRRARRTRISRRSA